MKVDNERELIEQAKEGSEGAFTAIVTANKQRVFRICLSLLRDAREADEAAQDVFVKLYESLERFRGESRISTWLYRVALNECASRRRGRAKLTASDDAGDPPDSKIGPDVALEQREAVDLLHRALDQMDEPFREVLVLRELEERTYEEIAVILEISIGTVESRLFRARQKLREILGKAEVR